MRRGGWIAASIGGVALTGTVVAVGLLGFVGVERTVPAGAQTRICGATVGVSVSEPGRSARLLGVSESALAAGDRVRVHPHCVVEVLNVEGPDVAEPGAEESGAADGAQAAVHLRWRLW
ncbi:hypothetical protein [Leucobacter chromiiresistens]|uniref:Uncharacterized protein n=1 Tax=Leucobacter chromiiresistens TaxID=1079994 RepID=A0A1H0Z5N5_9MICO|nr:hypothetical protein [Leucobacter chromiiresistens]SDQ22755.1 hypothetical protein SAMN04488565_1470 [Leucobacter chromiiresistens]